MVLLIVVAGVGSLLTGGGVAAMNWTETADFCGRCHTMGPELKAHAQTAHAELSCAECHVEPGIEGWIRAKLNGTRQLIEVLTGTFPKPIPPPSHADLPPTSATCVRCHSIDSLVANGGPVKLVMTTRYQINEPNTKDQIALVLRPAGFGGTTGTVGVHWHIVSDVEYATSDARSQKIDEVTVKNPDGSTAQYIASGQVSDRSDPNLDIRRVISSETVQRMDCITCHNRVGHQVPTVDSAVDDAMSSGLIDDTLPYVKDESVTLLSADYPTVADAERAIDGLKAFYSTKYPQVLKTQAAAVDRAIAALKSIYSQVATPDMKVTASTYPNNLGHQASPGCFRCHDGAHYKVVNGVVTDQTIPSGCATCHTFPQVGTSTQSGILIGDRPQTHQDPLWVFNHKYGVTSVDPSNQSCGACHTRTYCQNCHNTDVVKVDHQDMIFNHAAVVQKVGSTVCAFCHQRSYCAQCHADVVLADPYGTDIGKGPSPSPVIGGLGGDLPPPPPSVPPDLPTPTSLRSAAPTGPDRSASTSPAATP